MDLLKDETIINICFSESETISTYLRVYLAKERLTNKQLDVTTQLVVKYAQYVKDNVREPYASTLLFSTEVRKEIYTKLNISAAHFTNTLKPLVDKGILAIEDDRYLMNPEILPSKKLVFNFKIDAVKK
tara:strand:- start:345 stop:731 length:387 start_codon:yes stop_codon:yes gene_type:complete